MFKSVNRHSDDQVSDDLNNNIQYLIYEDYLFIYRFSHES